MILAGSLPDMGVWSLVINGVLVGLLAPTGGLIARAVAGTWRSFWLGTLAYAVVGPSSAVIGVYGFAGVGLGWLAACAVGLTLRPPRPRVRPPEWDPDDAELRR